MIDSPLPLAPELCALVPGPDPAPLVEQLQQVAKELGANQLPSYLEQSRRGDYAGSIK